MDTDREGAPPPLPSPGRLWTAEEANTELEELRELLPRIRAGAVRLQRLREELTRLEAFWGDELNAPDHPDRAVPERLRGEGTEIERRLQAELGQLHQRGIEVKDVEAGLVDFYGLQDGEVVFLCWQRDEEAVEYFHRLDGSYRTRRPIRRESQRLPRAHRT